jgi:hypothetical protein
MSESENVSSDIWEYIKNNPKIVGLPIAGDTALDVLNAMRDVHDKILDNPEVAADMLTMLAGLILSTTQGNAKEILDEVIVASAMHEFDSGVKGILNEK